ncbi:malate dehydrogenase [Pseudoalteromonas sp. 13-15]|jgi:malate dehydrogenase (oxaloacetate-decarboxylating)(NADP+)|uniref:Malic enzyme-like NAD(P)-binding protein n=2 Tax=Gammaproteobacteria TaxID=1236 RepID=A0ABT9FD91_9GAMM|nr:MULTISPECIES: malic enzyme-like NAD(P)-binding protein [Pseudoalteromonas]EAW27622.1 putative NADP-dependent malic enzyme (NADP-dependent malic oxidoreductase (N-terminal); phosphotransacetylase [Alteromonadales bacterium TW-7]MBL1385333.1 malate dehydrogenase [Colwellia sp.]ATG59343.1 malate dehydrogenase [Pseudoalteromonas marina]AUL74478.1 malate dehydrogenase [Pseudoalteromonas sp. 13-15]MCK8120474.1 malate dehydrogenase [Pseudoalteromonas sp. 2CM32C]|tara:strand:- start:324 stop:1565 length:1242 start_codon:yes stop_codon:yes gene_type:complete
MSDFREQALHYHSHPVPGKISIELTKPAETVKDLALAYSPGVAEPVREIAADPANAYKYTGKGNMVAVITNGTAILGLGNLGPLASKPVMEGKALLFKRFAGLDSIDIEVKHRTTEDFINTVANIADTFGGINLEDIKAPECFEIEKALIERCSIPIFHDDQHGTAIVTAAGMLNALEVQGKSIENATIVCLGAGAAAVACMELLIKCGALREHIYMLDRKGVIHTRRDDLNEYKKLFANNTDKRTLQDVIEDADVFVGVSGPNLLAADDLKLMAEKPVVFACSNPDPEIDPALAHSARNDLIMATGRSDYPNQVNNVLCFPFIFRGALDVRASAINDEMKIAAVEAIRSIAKEPVPAEVLTAAGVDKLEFGDKYIIPKPMDPRLLPRIAKAVAIAAVESGVAQIDLPENYME